MCTQEALRDCGGDETQLPPLTPPPPHPPPPEKHLALPQQRTHGIDGPSAELINAFLLVKVDAFLCYSLSPCPQSRAFCLVSEEGWVTAFHS